ncbi:MAG: PilZ domain-containing protein [Thermodesulfobacteriota bacterium]
MIENQRPKRKNTRSQVWQDLEATIKVNDPFGGSVARKILTVSGAVLDLGGTGMFLKTRENVPVPAKAEITIDFDPSGNGNLTISAMGETVRSTADGVGIRFTTIDLTRLQHCIMARMNRS